MPKTTREALHNLVDRLPDFTWDEVNLLLQEYATASESGEYYIWEAPEVEPAPVEIAAIEEFYAEVREGRAELIPHAEVVSRFEEPA